MRGEPWSEPLAVLGDSVRPRKSEPSVYAEAGRDKPAREGARSWESLFSSPAPEEPDWRVADDARFCMRVFGMSSRVPYCSTSSSLGPNSSIRGGPLAPEDARLCVFLSPLLRIGSNTSESPILSASPISACLDNRLE